MTDEQELMKIAALGIDAEAFFHSVVGKALNRRAKEEATVAVEELKSVNPADTVKITELQNHIWKAESFIIWLSEIYQEGKNAERQLQNPAEGE